MAHTSRVALAVLCVDWRMHHPQSNIMRELYAYLDNPDRIYVVTYPGPDALAEGLAQTKKRQHFEETVQRTRDVLKAHQIQPERKVLLVHTECAGHAVSSEAHREHAQRLAALLDSELHTISRFEPVIASKRGDDEFTWVLEPVAYTQQEQRAAHG